MALWLVLIATRVAGEVWAHSTGSALLMSTGVILLTVALNRGVRILVITQRAQRHPALSVRPVDISRCSQHDGPVTDPATRDPSPPPSTFSRALNVAGVAIVALCLARDGYRLDHPLWVWILTGVALLAWLPRELLPGCLEQPGSVAVAGGDRSPRRSSPSRPSVLGFVPGLVVRRCSSCAPRGRPLATRTQRRGRSPRLLLAGAALTLVTPDPASCSVRASGLDHRRRWSDVSRRQYRVRGGRAIAS